jgi:outer membrane protein OmpA-like peptidoglycan-associated protein
VRVSTPRRALAGLLVVTTVGCASMNKTNQGALIGGGTGAVVGGIIGKQAGNTAVGAIVGAAVGGGAGAYIGHYMDKQAAEMQRDLEGAKVERIGEGIKITFDSGILFDVDKADLRPVAKQNLTELATILTKYDDTNVLIEGHTDSDGSDEHNLTLSERRARTVAASLAQQSVPNARMSVVGYGESQPVADNSSAAGKQANRRVEIAIMANEDLKKAAQKQAG